LFVYIIILVLLYGSNRLAYEYMALDIMWYTIKYTHYHTALVWHHYLPLRLTINKWTTKQKLDGIDHSPLLIRVWHYGKSTSTTLAQYHIPISVVESNH